MHSTTHSDARHGDEQAEHPRQGELIIQVLGSLRVVFRFHGDDVTERRQPRSCELLGPIAAARRPLLPLAKHPGGAHGQAHPPARHQLVHPNG